MMNTLLVLILDLCPENLLALRVRAALDDQSTALVRPLEGASSSPGLGTLGMRISAEVRQHRPDVLLPCLPQGARAQAECLFALARAERWDLPVLIASLDRRAEELEALLSLGAADFITEPIAGPDLQARLHRLFRSPVDHEPVVQELKARLGMRYLVGSSPRFLEVVRKIPAIARSGATVLILGETGTGKELCARGIHHLSARTAKPFVPVNCGAIPPDLVENELFGHAPGAYTGAASPAIGLVQEADGGSLFLDEIDCLPLSSQVKLLRFLQEKEFRPVGSTRTLPADVRVIAACNGDLLAAVNAGRVRRDLYYRLNVVSLTLPPLRQRREDVAELAGHFLARSAAEQGKPMTGFTPAAQQQLLLHDWPGNVRELQNVVERAVVFAQNGLVRVDDLDLPVPAALEEGESFQVMKAKAVEQFERSCLRSLLAAHDGNISAAARAARKNRRAFWELIRKHRLAAMPAPSAAGRAPLKPGTPPVPEPRRPHRTNPDNR